MKSTTSWFNSTLYRKTMLRFWPLWAGYSLLLAFMLPLYLLNTYADYSRAGLDAHMRGLLALRCAELSEMLPAFVFFTLVGGVICAMAAFGYLYNHRSACMLHSLPLRRETLFTTQYLAGLSFLLLPLLAVTAVTALVELAILPSVQYTVAFQSLGILFLGAAAMSVFFYSFAAFCAMFTGHILALPVFYGILNGLVAGIWGLVSGLMSIFFFGYELPPQAPFVEWLTPVWKLLESCMPIHTTGYDDLASVNAILDVRLEHPGVPAVYAAAGLVLAVLALLVYRRRQVETAGDVVSVALVRPLFRAGVAVCLGLSMGAFTFAFFSWRDGRLLILFASLWTAVGYFIAQMLLDKSFRVFHRWKGALTVTLCMTFLCSALYLDFFGVEARVPASDQIRSLSVSMTGGYPNDSARHLDVTVQDDPELLELFRQLHTAMALQGEERQRACYDGYTENLRLDLNYQLTNGGSLRRSYYSIPVQPGDLEDPDSIASLFTRILEDRELMDRESYQFDLLETGTLQFVELDGFWNELLDSADSMALEELSGSQRKALWAAVRADYEAGDLPERSLFTTPALMEDMYATSLIFYWDLPQDHGDGPRAATVEAEAYGDYSLTYTRACELLLSPRSVNTLGLLEEYGVLNDRTRLMKIDYEVEDGAALEIGRSPVLPIN